MMDLKVTEEHYIRTRTESLSLSLCVIEERADMFDLGNYLFPSTSPTISFVSSSDLDTESTGSFFQDRSTTLGTLMGLSLPSVSNRVPSYRENNAATVAAGGAGGRGRKNEKGKNPSRKKVVVVATGAAAAEERRHRPWWKLCRDDGTRSSSFSDFLDVERRFGDEAFYAATAELEGIMAPPGNGRLLFADGQVLPPLSQRDDEGPPRGALCRFPVSLTGIFSNCGTG